MKTHSSTHTPVPDARTHAHVLPDIPLHWSKMRRCFVRWTRTAAAAAAVAAVTAVAAVAAVTVVEAVVLVIVIVIVMVIVVVVVVRVALPRGGGW